MKKKIYFVNGALGSGKTTLINQLILSGKLGKFFIIENEFSSFSVDSMCLHLDPKQVKTIAGECICCANPEELQNQLLALADSEYQNVVIESSGVTSLNQLLSKVINHEELLENFSIGGCIFLVDALGIDRTNVNDLEIANFVVVTKCDELTNIKQHQKIDDFIKQEFSHVHFLIKENVNDARWIEKLLSLPETNFRDWDLKVNNAKHHGQNFMEVITRERLVNFKPEVASAMMKEKQIHRVKGFWQKNGLVYHIEATPEKSEVTVSADNKDKYGVVVIGGNKVLLNEFIKKMAAV